MPRDITRLKIILLADWHFGARECNLKIVKKQIEELYAPDTYGICMGDLMENATTGSIGDTYTSLSPMEQLFEVKNMLEPVKNKIICGVIGNHENRSYKTEGLDLMRFLFRELGIEDKYNKESILVFLRVGETIGRGHSGKNEAKSQICYTIYTSHGNSGGRLPGAKANALSRMGQIVNCDVCLLAHSHLPLGFRDTTFEVNYGNSSVAEKETLYVNASSTLSHGGYSEQSQLRPMSMIYPYIFLDGTKKEARTLI